MVLKPKKMKNKYFLLFVGFIISWIYAIFIFYPQPGGFDWVGTAFGTLFYGFTWVIPITLFFLVVSKNKNIIRKTISNKYFSIVLFISLGTALLISWNNRFSNDFVFIIFWILTILLWLNIYLNLKTLNKI